MLFITRNITSILLIAMAVLVTLQLKSCLDGGKKAPDISGEIKAKDDLIKMIMQEREQDRRLFDSTISLLKQQDEGKIKEYKTTVIKYEKIVPTVTNLNREELRRAVTDF